MTPISLTTTEEIDGGVKLNGSWAELHSVARLDLLQDWIAVLQQLYQFVYHDTYGKGFDRHEVCVAAISGWDNHGKGPEDYRPNVLPIKPGERP
jgi:hypothetical protein